MNKRISSTCPLITLAVTLVAYASALGSIQAQDFHPGDEQIVGDMGGSVVQGEVGSYVGDLPAAECTSCGGSVGGDMGAMGGGVQRREFGQPDLFYNFYTQGYANRTNAQMYLSPLPIPPNVGHTFYTYQPFYPHEMLYHHKDRFHRYYDNGRGMNRTRASYYSPPVRQFISNVYWNYLRLPR